MRGEAVVQLVHVTLCVLAKTAKTRGLPAKTLLDRTWGLLDQTGARR
jgi:hypothetical protein